jgi:biopolymer transport protein TolQ
MMRELLQFVFSSGAVAQFILLILLIMSIISWTLVIEKARRFAKIKKESNIFLNAYRMRGSWSDLYRQSREFSNSPFARLFRHNYTAFQSYFAAKSKGALLNHPVKMKLESTISEEIAAIEKRMIFLSTTVSVSPFLGLFGTVWGIMTAFMSIGIKGSANIVAVGPGIAEALITTVAGLAVAIPALVAYNYFVDKIRQLETELENFAIELVILVEQENQS